MSHNCLNPARQRVVASTLAVLALAAFLAPASAQETAKSPEGLRLFYTGHSFHMFVPGRVDLLAKAANIEGHKVVGTQGIGGSRVIQHWDLADDKNKAKPALIGGNVDVFTMAAHLAIPDDGITNFTELGLKHNPKLRLLVQGSWYPFDVSGDKRIKNNIERNDMKIADLQAAVDEWRTKLEKQADDLNKKHGVKAVYIVPVGDAVVKLRALVVDGKYPGVKTQAELFTDPIGHAGPHVAALAGYCNYVAIYRASPVGLKPSGFSQTDEQQELLQKIAWETVSKYPHAGVARATESKSR